MSVFSKLLDKGMKAGQVPSRSASARAWFRQKASRENAVVRKTILSEKQRGKSNIQVGRMYFFQYDAKLKDKLPYWDAFPLIFPFRETGKHFYALNLHYLPPKMRAVLMDQLYDLVNNDKYDSTTRLVISYRILSNMAKSKYIAPCVKMYLKSNVRSQFIQVEPTEWDIALFLPVAQWRNSTVQKVYADAKKAIGTN